MSSLVIHDLTHEAALDQRRMAAVRGGFGPTQPINVVVNSNQQIGQFQKIDVNVLNNNRVIGAGFVGPDLDVAASLWAQNKAAL